MHVLRFLPLVATTMAFTIPEGQPDGVYEVSIVDGREIHTLAQTISTTDTGISSSRAFRRSVNTNILAKRAAVTCGGDGLDHNDTDFANNELDKQCLWEGPTAGRVEARRSLYSIRGCTVAYVCNFSSSKNPYVCTPQIRRQRSAEITNWCGLYRSGWANEGENSYGYENFCKSPGNNFCGHGRN